MKYTGYCLIRFLSAVLCWLIVFAIMLPIVPSWGSEDFRFFRWLFSVAVVIIIPSIVAVIVLFIVPLPGEKEAEKELEEDQGNTISGNADESSSRVDNRNYDDYHVITSRKELNRFRSSHIIVGSFDTKVVGVTFDNSDGSSRQQIISQCASGDEVYLHFFKYYGDPAYAVHTRHGQIGNIAAEIAASIDRNYDGCIVQGTINKITGGHSGYPFGCNIHLTFYREN